MARSKKDAVNKSQAIRDALSAHPDKSPSEIAVMLVGKGLNVNAQYVSTIKSAAKAKGRGGRVVRRRKPGRPTHDGLGPIGAALKFINEAGGLQAAKHALETVEEIRAAVH
jgi:hypothetical protein